MDSKTLDLVATIKKTRIAFLIYIALISFPQTLWAKQSIQDFWKQQLPSGAEEVLYVRSFVLDKAYSNNWQKGQKNVDSGIILVLRVKKELVPATNEMTPVLYAGNLILQRLNIGDESGHVIVIVPEAFDLSKEIIWFGQPDLPSAVNAESIAIQRQKAEKSVKLLSEQQIQAVTLNEIRATDFSSLLGGEISRLILKYSPQEASLAKQWRLPEAKASYSKSATSQKAQ